MEKIKDNHLENLKLEHMKSYIKEYPGTKITFHKTLNNLQTLQQKLDVRRWKSHGANQRFDKLIFDQECEMKDIFLRWHEYHRHEKLLEYAIELHTKVVMILQHINRGKQLRDNSLLERQRLAERQKMIPSILRDFAELPFCLPFITEKQQQPEEEEDDEERPIKRLRTRSL